MTDPITLKIQELVPEIKDASIYDQAITLADVLRAIEAMYDKKVRNVKLWSAAELHDMQEEQAAITRRWNLATDYDGQDQPTKDFIGKLIGI